MAASSLAGELLEIINENRYKTNFQHLSEDHVVSSEVIKSLKKDKSGGRDYDTSRFQNRRGNIIPDGLYSLFTKYAGESCSEIRDKLSTWVVEHRSELVELTRDSFKTHKPDFSWWNLAIINKRRPGDELSLFCLCKIYHRHAIIYTEIDYWTTLADTDKLTEEDVISKCDIVLVYLGNNKFCEVVKTNNANTSRKRVTKSLRELCSETNSIKTSPNPSKSSNGDNPRVKLNPTKHGHDTRGSVRKRHNDRPSRVQSRKISYVPDPTSSETENEPPRKRRYTLDENNEIGPSQTRIEAQRMITRQRLQTKENVTSKLIGTCVVSPPAKLKEESDNKLNIKLEIKLEQSKPLTKEQKERRRRRNRKENEETEWEHVHYKRGKGFLKHCEHTVAHCKFTNTTLDHDTAEHESEGTINDANQHDHHVSVKTKNAIGINGLDTAANSSKLDETVNAKNANEEESVTTDSIENTMDNSVSANNSKSIEITSHVNNTTVMESESFDEANSTNIETEGGGTGRNDQTTNGVILTPQSETKESATPSNPNQSPTTSTKSRKKASNAKDNSRRERDAVDGLLLLSSGEETMDELALSQDEGDTIEFNEELDMENMMTALHIDNQNAEKTLANTDSETSSLSVKHRDNTGYMNNSIRTVKNNNIQNRTAAQSTSSRGHVKIRSVTLKRHKEPTRKYYCSLCNDNAPYKGLQALNIHHRDNHNPVQCKVCNKWCSTPESLRRHSYDHYDKTETCNICGEAFHFKSELKAHKIIHDERDGIHQCMKGGCGKRYMRKGELVAHAKTHTGKLWKCPWKKCTYEAIDKRYLYQHKKGHSKNNYICKYCQEGFTHYMQRKRHYEKSHSQ